MYLLGFISQLVIYVPFKVLFSFVRYTKITHNGTTRGHDSIDNLRRIVTGIEDRKVEEAAIVFHKSDMGESLADTESSSFKYSPRQTESIVRSLLYFMVIAYLYQTSLTNFIKYQVTSDSELSETKTIEQIEREKELEQIPCPVFKVFLAYTYIHTAFSYFFVKITLNIYLSRKRLYLNTIYI